eukprot:254716-Prymnesium_polylepis.2
MLALAVAGKTLGAVKHLLGGCKQQLAAAERPSFRRLSSEHIIGNSSQGTVVPMWLKRHLLRNQQHALPMLLFVVYCVTPATFL